MWELLKKYRPGRARLGMARMAVGSVKRTPDPLLAAYLPIDREGLSSTFLVNFFGVAMSQVERTVTK